jgi:hypothetical protein
VAPRRARARELTGGCCADGCRAAPAEQPPTPARATSRSAPARGVGRCARENAYTRARRGLLRDGHRGPRPPNHHPSCADGPWYVRDKTRPIEITVAAPEPICSRSPTASRVDVSRSPLAELQLRTRSLRRSPGWAGLSAPDEAPRGPVRSLALRRETHWLGAPRGDEDAPEKTIDTGDLV